MTFNKRKQSVDNGRNRRIWTWSVLSTSIILLALWTSTAIYFLVLIDPDGNYHGQPAIVSHVRKNTQYQVNDAQVKLQKKIALVPHASSKLISRNPKVSITSSAKGNLGPPSVLNQNPPGKDWIKDRWQAASDMGGTAIPGSHWVIMDFSGILNDRIDVNALYVSKIILDWETAYAKDYRIEGRLAPPKIKNEPKQRQNKGNHNDDSWCVLYDGANDNSNNSNNKSHIQPQRSVEEFGQSPGVKQKLPLHIIHTIDWGSESAGGKTLSKGVGYENCHAMRNLRIFIRKPARGWGVSLWQVDVYGTFVAVEAMK